MSQQLLMVNHESQGAELRLLKAIRLMCLYGYTAKNFCWRRRTRHRYERAEERMRERLRQILRLHWPGYTHWQVKILGSHRVEALQKNQGLEFLVILTNQEVADAKTTK